MHNIFYRITTIIFLMMCACSSPPQAPDSPAADFTFNITIVNKTLFDVEILDDTRIIPRQGERAITLPEYFGELNDGYSVQYRVNLLDGVFVRMRRNENIIIKPDQNTVVIEAADFEAGRRFLVLHNNGNQIISLKSDKDYLNPLAGEAGQYSGTPYLTPGSAGVYELTPGLKDLAVETDQYRTITLSPGAVAGYICTFSYNGNDVSLTDARPLRCIGESGWVKEIPEATGPMPLAAGGGGINLFAQTEQGLARYTFDSTGNATAQVKNRSDFDITFAAHTGDVFFLAGYENLADGEVRPVAQVQGADGGTGRALAPSARRDCRSAYFLTAAQKDGSSWLAAGGGGENAAFGHTAYARLVRDSGGALTAVWELAGADFAAPASDVKCGEITSAVYDPARGCWLAAGKIIAFDSMRNPINGSYVAVINENGKIRKIDTSFRGMSFNKILTDTDGAYYLAGEEQKENETRAILVKYDANDKQLWRLPVQAPSHSWYQTAILDSANSRIILGGILQAASENGNSGIPFVEAADTEKGTLLWRERLADPSLSGAALVTEIIPAPDYGFALTLCGIADDSYAKPFMIARINAQGKFSF